MNVIAEAGLNWNNFNEAIQMCDAAKQAGADYVKFQIVDKDGSMASNCKLTFGEWKVIKRYCQEIGINFMATPSNLENALFLISIGCDIIKIGSDHVLDKWIKQIIDIKGLRLIMSNGYYNIPYDRVTKMYCVSLYPCDKKYIRWNEMGNYKGFSDHTLEISQNWCNKIKEKNLEWYEKHFTLGFSEIDLNVSVNLSDLTTLIGRLK